MPAIKVSVRALVEHFHRSGDLTMESWEQINPLEAIRAHQKVQKSRPKEYRSEVSVSFDVDESGYRLEISGRMDGLFEYADRVVIEEIKTTRRELSLLEAEARPVHWAQAKLYAYIHAAQVGLEQVGIQLTYYQLDTRKKIELQETFLFEDLERFFQDVVCRYVQRLKALDEWRAIRDSSIAAGDFPFTNFRSGQRPMAVGVYRAIRDHTQLLVEAPTGIGKTMASLFPAVKALGSGLTDKIMFLTARTTGKSVAEKAIEDLRRSGVHLRTVTLTAKEKTCFNPGNACTGEDCNFARGYYDRVDGAVQELVDLEAATRTDIERAARAHAVCPFELSLELTLLADVIVCDYNYAFDPRVSLRRIFLEEKFEPTFIVDEAHNLVDRARDIFSAELWKSEVAALRRKVKPTLPGLGRKLTKITTWYNQERRRCLDAGGLIKEEAEPETLYPLLRKFLRDAEPLIPRRVSGEWPFRDDLVDFFFGVNRFLRVAEHYDSSYTTIIESAGRSDLKVRLFCMDPSGQLREALAQSRSAVFCSATLSPASYFRALFGCEPESPNLQIPPPFPAANLCLMIADHVATTYRERGGTIEDVVELLTAFIGGRRGNYLIFFPSYEYMSMVRKQFDAIDPSVRVIEQSPGMSEEEREVFLTEFVEDRAETLVGFAVMGGVFGEAIDLVGERLTGAAVVSVGLPGLSPERELIRDYFQNERGQGFEYAYSYPGLNRVLQASGRVIRTETDRGAVLLIDRRYNFSPYREMLPRQWTPIRVSRPDQVKAVLTRFWSTSGRPGAGDGTPESEP